MNWEQKIRDYGERHNLTNEDVEFMINMLQQALAENELKHLRENHTATLKEKELLQEIYNKIDALSSDWRKK